LSKEEVEVLENLTRLFPDRGKGKPAAKKSGFRRSAGAWKGLKDPEQLKRYIYESRVISTRPKE